MSRQTIEIRHFQTGRTVPDSITVHIDHIVAILDNAAGHAVYLVSSGDEFTTNIDYEKAVAEWDNLLEGDPAGFEEPGPL